MIGTVVAATIIGEEFRLVYNLRPLQRRRIHTVRDAIRPYSGTRSGIPERGVVACIACHGPSGRGNPLASYPMLQGQHATCTANTLRAYAAGSRRSDATLSQMMRTITVLLLEDELQAVSSYVQGLR